MKNKLNIDHSLADSISNIMKKKGFTVSVAESCTGGFLSTFFISKSGASSFFKGSIVSYSNESKINFLDINENDIIQHGVVSKFIVEKMAVSVRKKFNTNYGLATTGYVELSDTKLIPKNYNLHAWISISSKNNTISKSIVFKESRLDNICAISYALLDLFRKEII